MVKRRVPNIVRGGKAIPIKGKTNYYYMSGRKHENGGIDIGKNPRTGLEVEDGEVMHITDNNIKVFSAQPFLNGESPAEKVMKGDNPDKVFNAQEKYKNKNNINDDGTKKKRMGGDDIQYIYNKVNKKNTPDFIRMRNPKRKSIPDWRNNKYTSTNKVAVGTDSKRQVYLYNDIQDDGKGGLIDMSNPKNYKNGRYMGQARAEERGDTIHINSIQDGLLFSEDYKNYYPGFPKTKRMGGLIRSKDYGSKSKPYPKVKAEDFAGGNRSYPIPTKADAVDALRLAGLHGRSDIRAKVYNKYPELRKKSKAGGLYSVTVDGKTKLKMFPSTGEKTNTIMKYGRRKKAKNGTTYINGNNLLVPDIDIPEKIIIPKTVKTNTNKISSFIKNNPDEIDDYISLVSNIGSNLIGRAINNKALNKMSYSSSPIPKRAVKLKTNININPQLDKMRESLASYERNIDNNTSSSSVALSRKQRARAANILQTNELYGNKENLETELINKDKLNQQTVANDNIKEYNEWAKQKAIFDNMILEKKAENNIATIGNINTGIQDVIQRKQKRKSENNTITAMTLSNPNLPAEMYYASGIWNKKLYDKYRKTYPLNK